MSKIISIHSFRGGTGKSNICANLAVTVARAGNRVGVIDTDIQSPGIHVIFGLKQDKVDKALNDYLWGECSIEQASYDVSAAARKDGAPEDRVPGLLLIPSSLKVGEIARVLKEGYDIALLNDSFGQLIDELKLDYLFIDTHPGVNEETLLSITISDLLLVVMRPDNQDFQGTAVTIALARLNVLELLLLVNKVPAGLETRVLKDHLARTYQAEVGAVFPLNFEIVELASSGIFCLKHPFHPFSEQIHLVAKRVMGR